MHVLANGSQSAQRTNHKGSMERRRTKLPRPDNYVDDSIERRSCGLTSSSYPKAPSFPSNFAASPETRDGHRPPKTPSNESGIASGASHAPVSHFSLARSPLPNTAARKLPPSESANTGDKFCRCSHASC